MTKARNVLVFPCGSEIGLEIFRSLSGSMHVNLCGGSSVSSNHGKYLYSDYIDGLPHIDDPQFFPAINHVIDKRQIDFLFPAHDSVVLSCGVNSSRLHCNVIGSPADTCRICRAKSRTYEHLRSVVRVPALYHRLDKASRWPVFLKPDVGQGSRGTHLARCADEAAFYLKQDPSLLAMEYLPGSEYTIDCFTDRHGQLRFAGPRARVRVQNGISVHARPVEDGDFQEMAAAINRALEFRGAWFFQVKRDGIGNPVLMEVAPRVAGTMGFYRNLGINLPLLSVFDAMDSEVEILPNTYHLEMDRALGNRFKTNITYKYLYIDLDDCLLRGDKVNTQAIALLYHCLNNDIKVRLLTRHAGSLDETLERKRLAGLFDEVIQLKDGEPKSKHVEHTNAVFVDDSFAERAEVHRVCDIPVFAPDALECLLSSYAA